MDVKIRQGEKEDAQEMAEMIKCLAEDQGRTDQPDRLTLQNDGFDETSTWFNSLVAEFSPENGVQKVLIGAIFYSTMYSATLGRVLFMSGFYVKPEFRRLGVGTKLYSRLKEIASSMKCKALRYFVHTENKNALNFYGKQGASNLSLQRPLIILSDNLELK